MKKLILLFLIFLVISFVLNNTFISNARNNIDNDMSNILVKERLIKLEKEVYLKDLIQYIEFESEIIIPEYFDVKYVEYTHSLADTLKIPIRTAFRLIYKESCFRDTVVSGKGAKGLMQLMPNTRKMYYELLCVDTLNLDKNQEDIYIGMNYLKNLYDFWISRGNSQKYSWKLSLASYNAGEGTVLDNNGIPPIKETTDFIAFILKTHSNPEFFANYVKKYENEIKDGT